MSTHNENSMSKTVTLRLDDKVYERFKNLAADDNRPLSNYIETAALRFIEENEYVIAQANASRINARIYSGFGGQTDFIVGALHAPGGQAFIALRSWHPKANVSTVMNIIGDVEGRTCLVVDDMVDTAGTLCKAADALKEHGAARVVAYSTHPVLSGPAIKNIENSNLDSLVVTDTIPLSEEAKNCGKIRQLSMAKLLAESIRRVSNEESISAMFDNT